MLKVRIALLSTLLLAPACADRPAAVPAAVLAERREAERNACIGGELLERAVDQVDMLARATGVAEGVEPRGPGAGPYRFALAYQQHASMRAATFAHRDSAVNHAATPIDSARHVDVVERMVYRAPEPGTLEGNVIEAYLRDFERIRNDSDHRCNW
jgi:hypothetical protein